MIDVNWFQSQLCIITQIVEREGISILHVQNDIYLTDLKLILAKIIYYI